MQGLMGHKEEPRLCLQGSGEPWRGLEQGRGRSLWPCVKNGWERTGLRQEVRKEADRVWVGENAGPLGREKGLL